MAYIISAIADPMARAETMYSTARRYAITNSFNSLFRLEHVSACYGCEPQELAYQYQVLCNAGVAVA